MYKLSAVATSVYVKKLWDCDLFKFHPHIKAINMAKNLLVLLFPISYVMLAHGGAIRGELL